MLQAQRIETGWHTTSLATPVGWLTICADETAVRCVHFGTPPGRERGSPLLREAARQIEAYFSGDRQGFDLPLAPRGTPFQQRVWSQLQTVPYATTSSYGRVAACLGHPQAARAVGGANHRNPIAIVIPCHRIVGADGRLTGYASGIERKAWLLAHEQRHAQRH